MVAGGDVAKVGAAFLQPLHRQALAVDVHQPAGQAAVFQHGAGAQVAGVFHRRHAAREQMRQTPQQVLDARTHHHLFRCADHPPVGVQIGGDLFPQGGVPLHFPPLEQCRVLVQNVPLQASPASGGKQPGVHAAGGKVVPGAFLSGCGGRRGRGGRPPGVQHAAGLLHKKAPAGAAVRQPLGGEHLVGGVHRVDAHPQLGGHASPPRQRGARRTDPGADLLRQHGVQLLIERGLAVSCQCDHTVSPLHLAP